MPPQQRTYLQAGISPNRYRELVVKRSPLAVWRAGVGGLPALGTGRVIPFLSPSRGKYIFEARGVNSSSSVASPSAPCPQLVIWPLFHPFQVV